MYPANEYKAYNFPMFPLKDETRPRRRPWITYAFVLINVLVFLYQLTLGPRYPAFVFHWGFVPARFLAIGDWPTVFTSMFMHADFLHIGGNMLFLWIFADNVEDVLGWVYFPIFYFLCGVGAVLLHTAVFPESKVPLIGASGAIAGVMAGYLMFFPKARILTLVFLGWFIDVVRMPAWILVGLWFLLQSLYSLFSVGAGGGTGIAYLAHVGGFITGLVLALPVFLIRRAIGLYPFKVL